MAKMKQLGINGDGDEADQRDIETSDVDGRCAPRGSIERLEYNLDELKKRFPQFFKRDEF